MNTLTLYVVLIASQGYWLGGYEHAVTLQPNAAAWPADVNAANITWQLRLGDKVLAEDTVQLNVAKPLTFRLRPPEVRVRTTLTLHLTTRRGNVVLDERRQAIEVFPLPDKERLAAVLKGQRICYWQAARPGDKGEAAGVDPLVALLRDRGIQCDIVTDGTKLALRSPDIVLVGPGALRTTRFGDPLLDLAGAGCSVLLLQQDQVDQAAGYDLVGRKPPEHLELLMKHPLLAGLAETDLQPLCKQPTDTFKAVRLPIDAPVQEIAFWPQASQAPAVDQAETPIDCLLAVRSVGQGRLIFNQLPLTTDGGTEVDARQATIVFAALQWMTTRPEPTLPPSKRTPPATLPAPAPEPNRIRLGE